MIFTVSVNTQSPEMLCEKGALKNFEIFSRKHLCQDLFFDDAAGLELATLLKKRPWHMCFACEFCGIFRNTHFLEHLRTAAFRVFHFLFVLRFLFALPALPNGRGALFDLFGEFLSKLKLMETEAQRDLKSSLSENFVKVDGNIFVFEIYDVTGWAKSNYSTHIAQYLKK